MTACGADGATLPIGKSGAARKGAGMEKLYRKSVTDRLSSPEQLDRMIVITTPALWLSLAGAALVAAAALLWAFFGRLPSKVSGDGIFLSSAGVSTVCSEVSGVVVSVEVAAGSSVGEDQLLLTVADAEAQREIAGLQAGIAAVESIAPDGAGDAADADAQSMLEAKAAALEVLNRRLEEAQDDLRQTQVTSDVAGVVSEVLVEAGSEISRGTELLRVRPEGDGEDIILCYLPLASGKNIKTGMQVIVCPTTVNRQEYGHMEATVIAVDDYVATGDAMKSMLGDDSLVNLFSSNGAVVGVTCRLRTDESTESGYYWSTKKGGTVSLQQGTLVSAEIVIEEKAPITLLIPLLKEKLTVEPVSGNGGATQ